MKNNILKIVLISILVLLIVASVAWYIVDIANGTPPEQNLFSMLAATFICLASLIRIVNGKVGARQRLDFYEREFSAYIKGAFSHSPFLRKKLLCAVRLYNENRLDKAAKYLIDLRPACKTEEDIHAVGLFLGLTFTDMGGAETAVKVYRELIDMNITSSTIYGNLGSLYSGLGMYEDAIANMRLSIQNDENNPAPYNNLAQLYFNLREFEKAKEYANKALQINHKFRQSSSLLAVIYSLEGDADNAEKYSHIAITSGYDPQKLKASIEYFKSIQQDEKEALPNGGEQDDDNSYDEDEDNKL